MLEAIERARERSADEARRLAEAEGATHTREVLERTHTELEALLSDLKRESRTAA